MEDIERSFLITRLSLKGSMREGKKGKREKVKERERVKADPSRVWLDLRPLLEIMAVCRRVPTTLLPRVFCVCTEGCTGQIYVCIGEEYELLRGIKAGKFNRAFCLPP